MPKKRFHDARYTKSLWTLPAREGRLRGYFATDFVSSNDGAIGGGEAGGDVRDGGEEKICQERGKG